MLILQSGVSTVHTTCLNSDWPHFKYLAATADTGFYIIRPAGKQWPITSVVISRKLGFCVRGPSPCVDAKPPDFCFSRDQGKIQGSKVTRPRTHSRIKGEFRPRSQWSGTLQLSEERLEERQLRG